MSEGEVQLRLGENAAKPESLTICKREILDIFDETSGHFAVLFVATEPGKHELFLTLTRRDNKHCQNIKQWKLHLKKCEKLKHKVSTPQFAETYVVVMHSGCWVVLRVTRR